MNNKTQIFRIGLCMLFTHLIINDEYMLFEWDCQWISKYEQISYLSGSFCAICTTWNVILAILCQIHIGIPLFSPVKFHYFQISFINRLSHTRLTWIRVKTVLFAQYFDDINSFIITITRSYCWLRLS